MQPTNIHITDDILSKYLAGNATVFEKQQIDEWVKYSENLEKFYAALIRWELQNPQFTPDVEKALEEHFSRVQKDAEPTTKLPVKWRPWQWMAAASVLVAMSVTTWIKQDSILYKTYRTAFGQTASVRLEDGSQVTLNANSLLRVPRFGFGNQTREVFLQGEGAFSVVHTPTHQPFIVKTNRKFEVLVLGTEFTVFSRERGAKVVLNKGKVQLRYRQGITPKEVTMKPGDLVMIDHQNQLKQAVTLEPEKYVAWKEHRFVFDETPLDDITYLFLENFGVKVRIENRELSAWTVSGSFTAQNASELLETLSEAANLRYRREGNEIVIYSETNL